MKQRRTVTNSQKCQTIKQENYKRNRQHLYSTMMNGKKNSLSQRTFA